MENISFMQLQFFSFSELNLHNNFDADSNCFQAILENLTESLGVHKILVRKIWFYPPPKRAKMRKNCTNQWKILKIDTFSAGGTLFYGQHDLMDIWAFLTFIFCN